MRRQAAAVAALLGLLVLAGGCGDSGSSAGGRLPAVEVVAMLSGDRVALDTIAAPVVVNLWYSTCAPCLKEMPDFEAVHVARGGEIGFIGVNIGEDAERAADFVAQVGVTYEQYLDPLGYVSSELGVTSMPTTFVIDAEGAIAVRHSGPMSQDELDEAIDRALAG